MTAVQVLAVLDAHPFHLRVDVLVVGASESGVDDLDALADAQHGDLPVVCHTCQQQLLYVALRRDAVQLLDGLFAQQQGVDVATSAEDDAVQLVEQFAQTVIGPERRNDEGDAFCLQHRLVIAFGQHAGLLVIVACDADDRMFLVCLETAVEALVDTFPIECAHVILSLFVIRHERAVRSYTRVRLPTDS